MKKIKANDLRQKNNIYSTKGDIIGIDEEGFFKTNQTTILTSQTAKLVAGEQYALIFDLSRTAHSSSSGVITFSKVSHGSVEVGLFAIHSTAGGQTFKSDNEALKGYTVSYNGKSYIAIKKPSNLMADICALTYLYSYLPTGATLEIVSASDVTDVVEL